MRFVFKDRYLLPWVPLWIVPVLFVMAVGTVWLRLKIVRTTYEISQTDKMIRNLRQDLEQEELRVTGLRSPRRLETIARTKYGLTQPKPEQIVHLANKTPAKTSPRGFFRAQ